MNPHDTAPAGPSGPLVVAACLALAGCGFEELQPVAGSPPTQDHLPDSIVVAGIEVSPPVIHAGDRVVLRDPIVPDPAAPVALYFWDSCAGDVSQSERFGREATWIAPQTPGTYDLAVNVTNVERPEPSRTIRLCVAPAGEQGCATDDRPRPELDSLEAVPATVVCAAHCETSLQARASSPAGGLLAYRWQTRRGSITGSGAAVTWNLPTLGCCPEALTAALTVCDEHQAAATGVVDVVATPE